MRDDYSFFELAGYTEEESMEFERICNENGIEYQVLLNVLSCLSPKKESLISLISSIDTTEPKEMRRRPEKHKDNYMSNLLSKYGRVR